MVGALYPSLLTRPLFAISTSHNCFFSHSQTPPFNHLFYLCSLPNAGTLTPIVSNPDAAFMSVQMRDAVRSVAQLFPTAIISGRGREKVQEFVALKELYYAGSHGMDIVGPVQDGKEAEDLAFQPAAAFGPIMNAVYEELIASLVNIAGSSVEHNKFCVSVHFRNCLPEVYPDVVAIVDRIVASREGLRITRGRKVLELRPQVDWDKGTALVHLLDMLGLKKDDVYCLYIGDDRTDEDAFKALSDNELGDGILVSSRAKPTAGRWTLRDPNEVAIFLNKLISWGMSSSNRWHSFKNCTGWTLAAMHNDRAPRSYEASPVYSPTAAGRLMSLPPLPPRCGPGKGNSQNGEDETLLSTLGPQPGTKGASADSTGTTMVSMQAAN